MKTKNAIDPKYLRRLRKKEGKTLKVWGAIFGVELNTAYRWEAGKQTIPESVPIILRLRRQIKELEARVHELTRRQQRLPLEKSGD